MGFLAVQQTAPIKQEPAPPSASPRSSPAYTMGSPAIFPPLNLRSTSTGSRTSFLPRAAFPQDDEHPTDDAARRNATALTIVELLARAGTTRPTKCTKTQPLPSLRPQSSNVVVTSSLPSLPKVVVPSLRKDGAFAFPGSSPYATHPRTPSTTMSSVSPADIAQSVAVQTSASPLKRGRAVVASGGAVNNSRKRQKDELTRLRAQVQELQRELEHLRSRMRQKARGFSLVLENGTTSEDGRSPTASASAGNAATGAIVVPVWERMAQHQKEEKSKAEMENLRLKGLIQEQLKISKGLEKLLRKRCKSSMTSGSGAETSASVHQVTESPSSDSEETALFASLASGLEARLAEMETVFEKGGLTQKKQELQESQMILDERRGPVMEVKDVKILPFDVQACAAAVWQSIEAESEATVVGGASTDTLCFKSSVPLRQHRAPDVELTVRCVIRRVVDKPTGRVVFVWESLAECPTRVPHMCANAKGVEIRDCGWGLLEPLKSPIGEHSSILQLCSYLMPKFCGVSAEQSRQHIHGLAELVVPSYRCLWSKRQRSVENTLMNGAISARNNHLHNVQRTKE
ncbi:hypothetical protein PsorP6_015067 [Peronosclerospora sorghi]|uniref:Uncharacterized protein n=1 Tax=Peronosclerospora sorghi TaxID=230839 RepID=A0ACC0VT81_9STRA|nr:hypothetical protein PsorP6_015067 [Peronosclerospora sorghi]